MNHDPQCACFGCKVRSLYVGRALRVNRLSNTNQVAPSWKGDAPWEAGRVLQHRADGTVMPYIKADGNTLSLKEHSENRHYYDDQIRRAHAGDPGGNP